MCYKLCTYWIPSTKKEAIDFLVKHTKHKQYILRQLRKDQIMAIYHKERSK